MNEVLIVAFHFFIFNIILAPLFILFLRIPSQAGNLLIKWRFFQLILILTLLLPFFALLVNYLPQDFFSIKNQGSMAFSINSDAVIITESVNFVPVENFTIEDSVSSSLIIKFFAGLFRFFLILWIFSMVIGLFRFLVKIILQESLLWKIRQNAFRYSYQGIPVFVSPRLDKAFCRVLLRAEIYIPQSHWEIKNLSSSILVHETIHIKKGHPQFLFLAQFLRYMFQLNPFMKFLLRRGEELSEYICDYHGTRIIPKKEYLTQLINSAEINLKTGSFRNLSTPWLKQGMLKKRVKLLLTLKTEEIMKPKKLINIICLVMIIGLLGLVGACEDRINHLGSSLLPSENSYASDTFRASKSSANPDSENNDEIVHYESVNNIQPIFPIDSDNFFITLHFGMTVHPFTQKPYFHKGLDIAESQGYPVLAVFSGKIVEIGDEPETRGKYMIIQSSSGYQVLFSHLQSSLFKENDMVSQGQIVGKLGNTGLSTGPHLHFEIHDPKGEPVDPLSYFPDIE